jgi:hypothetical protein
MFQERESCAINAQHQYLMDIFFVFIVDSLFVLNVSIYDVKIDV